MSEDDFDPIQDHMLSTPLARVESLLFASSVPLQRHQIAKLLVNPSHLDDILDNIKSFWHGRGLIYQENSQGISLVVNTDFTNDVTDSIKQRKFSQAALATLAIIALHQPISVAQIENVRQVKLARGIIEHLLKAGFIEIHGRKTGTGRAINYKTTEAFLEFMNLDSLLDLPTPEEIFMLDIDAR